MASNTIADLEDRAAQFNLVDRVVSNQSRARANIRHSRRRQHWKRVAHRRHVRSGARLHLGGRRSVAYNIWEGVVRLFLKKWTGGKNESR